ncbi:MAG: SDR family oxidoreductase [Bacteroidetes bacterium]|nr:SDR family oxidoreductase [Bacteroidota bacterium]HET6244543.1 SDR family oxidoreductase [Bacteroidia bacterium]
MQIKNILITGAGSGIGRETAIALAKKGHRVIATTHKLSQAHELKDWCEKNNISLEAFQLDVTIPKDREKILTYDLDVLINNAGMGESGSLAEIPVDKIRNNFEVNVFSPIALSQLCLKHMMKKDKGSILFIGSLAGRVAMPFLGSYSMTKFALAGGIDSFRQEMRKITKNVHVSIIEPGAYHTGFNQKNVAKKFEWMNEQSYFYKISEKIKREEQLAFKILEHKSLQSIVKKIVKASEAKNPAFRYSAPFWQAAGVYLLRVFGK